MIPVFVSFPEANTDLPSFAPSPSVIQDVLENMGWEAVGGITGLRWVGNKDTHFHKVNLKFGARDLWLATHWCPASKRSEKTAAEGNECPSRIVGRLPVTPAAFWPPSKILQVSLSIPFLVLVYFRKVLLKEKH